MAQIKEKDTETEREREMSERVGGSVDTWRRKLNVCVS